MDLINKYIEDMKYKISTLELNNINCLNDIKINKFKNKITEYLIIFNHFQRKCYLYKNTLYILSEYSLDDIYYKKYHKNLLFNKIISFNSSSNYSNIYIAHNKYIKKIYERYYQNNRVSTYYNNNIIVINIQKNQDYNFYSINNCNNKYYKFIYNSYLIKIKIWNLIKFNLHLHNYLLINNSKLIL